MSDVDPRVQQLGQAVAELLEGYAEMRRVLEGYDPPDDARVEILLPLQRAAERAVGALREG